VIAGLLAAAPGFGAVDAPTYSRDVAPIFFEKCASCHRPGEVAPMSLTSYDEARPWARSIAKQVANRDMPPWSGDSERHAWSNDISLSDEEIATIVAWARQGASEGDAADLPELPDFPEGWVLGEPDHVVTLDEVVVPAEGYDIFTKGTVKVVLDEPRWVRAIQFLPGDRRVAHHYQALYATSPREGQKRAQTGVLGIWTAGMPPYVFPEGMGRVLGKETTLILDNHYTPMGEETVDVSRIGLYFGEGELQKEVSTVPVTNTGLRIPPGADHHSELAQYVFQDDTQILAFSPHMHVRGKAMRYDLVYPDGSKEMLLDVPKFDYNWQWLYYPTEPVIAPAGSRIDVTAVWDNSENNPANPDPSKEIIYRGDTYNEMFNGFLEVAPAEGVYNSTGNTRQRILDMLALHPAESSFVVGGFLQLGFHVPREGEGWLYMQDIFSISLDDFEWNGDQLRITTQFPTPEASAITTVIEGALNEDGAFEGKITMGVDTGNPQTVPIVGKPFGALVEASAAGL
jgi:hypothetical protein